MIPICLILFILFIAVITFAIKRADSAQAKVTEEFWEKERKANSTLRGDTTDLCYITIPEKFFPLNNDKINDLRKRAMIVTYFKPSTHLLIYLLRYSSYSLEA